MAYREPGVYLELINARPNTGFTPSLVPVVIGEGPRYLDFIDVPMTRANDAIANPPTEDAVTEVSSITVTHEADDDGEVIVILNGTEILVEVVDGDSVLLVAGKIADVLDDHPDYSAVATSEVVTVTAIHTGVEVDVTFDGGTTGVTANVEVTTQGRDGSAESYVDCEDSVAAGSLTELTPYYYKITLAGPGGESLASGFSSIVTGSGINAVKFTVDDIVLAAGAFPAGVTSIKVYFGTEAGNVKYAGSLTSLGDSLTVTALPSAEAVIPPITNSTNWVDVLPSTEVTLISRIYNISSSGTQVDIPSTGNWELATPNVIRWTNGGPNVPENGTLYYVDYEARPEAMQYDKTFISNFDDLKTAYVGDLMKLVSGGEPAVINPVYLGAYIVLESGAPGVYVIQVEPADKESYDVVMATDIATALEKCSFIEDAYYIVPMTSDSIAVGSTITHCTVNSTIEERKERVTFVNLDIPAPNAFSGIFSTAELDAAIAECKALADKRVRVPFAVSATKVLSDGNLYTLGAEYVCAAMAGLAAALPVYKSLTRQKLYNFVDLNYVTKLSRYSKNKLAEAGYIVLEQPGGSGGAIVIRHGVTTKMDNVADREHSIVTIADYVAKYIRSSLEGYIGVFNIDGTLITKVNGTITACFNTLTRANVIVGHKIGSLAQDADNPDTLLIDLSIKPPYPCNYINIKLLIE